MTAGRLDTAGPLLFLVGSERSATTLLRLMLDHHPEIASEKEFDFVLSKVSDTGAFPPLDGYLEWIATVRGADYAIDRSLDYRQLANDFLRQKQAASGASLVSARRCIATATVSGSSGRTLDISTSYTTERDTSRGSRR